MELVSLDEQKAALITELAEPQLPALHPNMAEVFRWKATTRAAGLEQGDQRDAARDALRGFVEKIVIPLGTGLLQGIWGPCWRRQPEARCLAVSLSLMLVAGARCRQYRTLCMWLQRDRLIRHFVRVLHSRRPRCGLVQAVDGKTIGGQSTGPEGDECVVADCGEADLLVGRPGCRTRQQARCGRSASGSSPT